MTCEVSGKLLRLPVLSREYVDLLSNNDLKGAQGSASAFYRLFQLVYLGLRENL